MKNSGVVAFAFGAPEGILSNRRIAKIASECARKLSAVVYTQRNIRVDSHIEVWYTEEELGNPPTTLKFARRAVRWARGRGIAKLYVVAAKPHLQRCVRDLVEAVREAAPRIDVQICAEVYQYSERYWFCLDSAQKRTRSRKKWERREKILMFLPFFVYKRIAG